MAVFEDEETSQQDGSAWGALREELRLELEQAQREIKEISLLLEQSQLEVNKLAQRNASINARLQQVQTQFDSLPRQDIRASYDAALDAQQRLFVMRGQIEKLQSDRAHIERNKSNIERMINAIDSFSQESSTAKSNKGVGEVLEMLVQAQEAERQRLARQMHDEPAQALSNFILQTEIAMRLLEKDPARAKEELLNLKTASSATFKKVRDFIFELRPMMLDDLGLAPTVNRYIDVYKTQTGLDIRVTVTGMEQRLEPYMEVMVFRAIQELLGNAARHSQATLVKVQIDSSETDVRVTVDDNGKGFDATSAMTKGLGLKLIKDRLEMLGGTLEVDSVIGQGSRITFQIPARKTKLFA